MSKTARLVILFVILGVCTLDATIEVVQGKQPSEALFGVLGTIVTYVLLESKKDQNEDEDEDGKKKRTGRKKRKQVESGDE